MFKIFQDKIGYVQNPNDVPSSVKIDSLSMPPINHPFTSDKPTSTSNRGLDAGCALVCSYLDYLRFRSIDGTAKRFTQSNIKKVYDKALELDQIDGVTNMDIPSLVNVMIACREVLNKSLLPRFVKPEIANIKSIIHRYGAVIVEVHQSSSFENMSDEFAIETIENPGNDNLASAMDFSKGFIAYGYDSQYLLIMNSLGLKWGNLGFAKVKFSELMKPSGIGDEMKFLIKCAYFKNGIGG